MEFKLLEDWALRIRDGERTPLARAITLAESTLDADRSDTLSLLALVNDSQVGSLRLAITGPPGAGKSTLIDVLGMEFIRRGHRVGVLTVDPSSPITGGSILGDKTRMRDLTGQVAAFVRPSPSQCASGGIAPRTRECVALMEAAGFTIIMIETVGVGQSDYAVTEMVDAAMLVMVPGTGDSIQAHKRGILEMVDMVVINKCDGVNQPAAELMRQETEQALNLRSTAAADDIVVRCCSALEMRGIGELAGDCINLRDRRLETGSFAQRRMEQAHAWLSKELKRFSDDRATDIIHAMDSFRSGSMSAYQALAYVSAAH